MRGLQNAAEAVFKRDGGFPLQQGLHLRRIAITRLHAYGLPNQGFDLSGASGELDEELCHLEERRKSSCSNVHAGPVMNPINGEQHGSDAILNVNEIAA